MFVPRAIGLILVLRFASLRLLLIPSLLGMGKRSEEPDRLQVPVTPFTLTANDGTPYDCMIRGEVRGGFLKLGEHVEVSGRLDRSHVLLARRVRSLRTGAITRGHADWQTWMAPAGMIVTIVIALALIMLFVGFLAELGER